MRNRLTLSLLIVLSLACGQARGAGITTTTQFEFDQGTGSATYGGGYDPSVSSPGTNYAWGASAGTANSNVFVLSNLATSSAGTVVFSSTRNFIAADNGNVLQFTTAGGATAGFYTITTISGGSATINAAQGTSLSGCFAVLGGQLAGPPTATLLSSTQPGNVVWFRGNGGANTYTLTGAIAAGTNGTGAHPIAFIGYNTTHGDNPHGSSGNAPTIAAGVNVWTFGGFQILSNVNYTAANTSAYAIVMATNNGGIYNSRFTPISTGGIINNGSGAGFQIVNCEFAGGVGRCISGGSGAMLIEGCYIHDTTTTSPSFINMSTGAGGCIVNNVFDSCGSPVNVGTSGQYIVGNTFVNCCIGITFNNTAAAYIVNNNFCYNATAGSSSAESDVTSWTNNNFYGNGVNLVNVATSGPFAQSGSTANNPMFPSAVCQATGGSANAAGTTFNAGPNNLTFNYGSSASLLNSTSADTLVILNTTSSGVYALSSASTAGFTLSNGSLQCTLAGSGISGATKTGLTWGMVVSGGVLVSSATMNNSTNLAVTNSAMSSTALPLVFPGTSTSAAMTIGAVQYSNTATAGGTVLFLSGGSTQYTMTTGTLTLSGGTGATTGTLGTSASATIGQGFIDFLPPHHKAFDISDIIRQSDAYATASHPRHVAVRQLPVQYVVDEAAMIGDKRRVLRP